MTASKKSLLLLLGISLATQATTSLVGGLIGIGPFTQVEDLSGIASNTSNVYVGIILQIITALVILVLATALYQTGKHINKTIAIIAFGLYLTEVVLHLVTQIIVFTFAEVSQQFALSGDTMLIIIGNLLSTARNFCGNITMIPFGLGAILFYYLITKATIIPKWLGYWGIISVSLIFIGSHLTIFGVSVPFVLFAPYVPWEWVAGVYIFIKGLREKDSRELP